jgi:hypothetical protein
LVASRSHPKQAKIRSFSPVSRRTTGGPSSGDHPEDSPANRTGQPPFCCLPNRCAVTAALRHERRNRPAGSSGTLVTALELGKGGGMLMRRPPGASAAAGVVFG